MTTPHWCREKEKVMVYYYYYYYLYNNCCTERMRARQALKSVLSNRGLGIKAKKCLYEGVIVPTALYGAEAWGMRIAERRTGNVPR